MAIDMQGQEVGDCASHQLSPSKEDFHIQPWIIKILDLPIRTKNYPREVNPHMGVEESGNKEHFSTNVDMDGGKDIKMERIVLPLTRDVVMVDTNESINDTIMIVIWVGKTTTIEVVKNTYLLSKLFESNL